VSTYYRTKGFVLSKYDAREADQIFDIYTEDFGKLKILAKAIRKIKSKLRPGTELFYLSKVEFIQGRTFKTLTDAVVIEKFKNIRNDFEKLKIAYQIIEVSKSLIKGQEKDEKIFNLLNETFNKLNNCSLFIVHCSLIYYYFLWNLISILGYRIDLYNCAFCQKKLLPQKLYFSLKEKGIICPQCLSPEVPLSGTETGKKEVSPEVIKILRIFLKKDWPTLLRLKIDEPYKKSLKSISEDYLFYLEEKNQSQTS